MSHLLPPVDLTDMCVWLEALASHSDDGQVTWTDEDSRNLQALIDTVYPIRREYEIRFVLKAFDRDVLPNNAWDLNRAILEALPREWFTSDSDGFTLEQSVPMRSATLPKEDNA